MSLLFIGLSIPVLIFILIYNYNKNSAGIVSILNEAVAQTSQAGVERTQDLIDNTESPLRFRRTGRRRSRLFPNRTKPRSAVSRPDLAAHIDAVYVSFEDGYHRVVTRIDEDRGAPIPGFPRRQLALQLHRCDQVCPAARASSDILRHFDPTDRQI